MWPKSTNELPVVAGNPQYVSIQEYSKYSWVRYLFTYDQNVKIIRDNW